MQQVRQPLVQHAGLNNIPGPVNEMAVVMALFIISMTTAVSKKEESRQNQD